MERTTWHASLDSAFKVKREKQPSKKGTRKPSRGNHKGTALEEIKTSFPEWGGSRKERTKSQPLTGVLYQDTRKVGSSQKKKRRR